jgi:CRISPR-associated protein Cas1
MRQLLNTLYVTTAPSYLRLERETVRMEVEGDKEAQIPLHHLGAIVCFGNVLVSPALIGRCGEDGRAVVFLTRTGRFRGRVVGPQTGNVLLRKAQFEQAACPEQAVGHARLWGAGTVHNCRRVLVRAAREASGAGDAERLDEAAGALASVVRRLEKNESADTETVRGLEGEAARHYFAAFGAMVKREPGAFAMSGRSRRPPRDRVNAVLSFLYTMLLNDCAAAAEGVGLDPQVGFLHTERPGRPALGLDLMEELRAYLADRLALTLVNRRQLSPGDFRERDGGAVLLDEDGRKTVVTAYQERKKEKITHPLLDQQMELGLLPHTQARLLARTLRGDMDAYLPFLLQ